MRIDPVFVLAPRPKAPSIPTRRAFLIAGGTFLAGSAIGGACGYSMGASAATSSPGSPAAPAPSAPSADELKPSGDANLDYWRKLAINAPIAELLGRAPNFLDARAGTYPKDAILWRGVARMAQEIVDNPQHGASEGVIFLVVSHIEGVARPENPSLRELVPQLNARRAQARRKK